MSKKQLQIPLNEASKIVHVDSGEPSTTSLIIAFEFGRPHKNVLREIDSLVEDGTIDRLNFELISYTDEMNREQRAYRLNERAELREFVDLLPENFRSQISTLRQQPRFRQARQ